MWMTHLNTEETILEQHRYLSLLHLKKHLEQEVSNWPPGRDVRPNRGLLTATGFTAHLEHLGVASAHLCCLLWVTLSSQSSGL